MYAANYSTPTGCNIILPYFLSLFAFYEGFFCKNQNHAVGREITIEKSVCSKLLQKYEIKMLLPISEQRIS